jgi:anti-anti-sigma factor
LVHPNIDVTETGPAIVVKLKGTIGVVEVTVVDAELAKIAARTPPLVVLDLSGLMMIGSSAMGSLVGFRKDITKAGGVVRMAAVPPIVRESFRRALLDKLFKFFDSVPGAIDAPAGR